MHDHSPQSQPPDRNDHLDEVAFQRDLLDWFAANRRPLPWREEYDPYHVWISEIMAQQTQMSRVTPYFERFVTRFPDPASLAAAHEDEVLKLWEGLGYYSRARNLMRAAKVVASEHGGRFPDDPAAVAALPGIGPYTAGAILSVAFNQPRTAVDANVERVFARLFDLDKPVKEKATKAFIHETADRLRPEGRARDFNQALMEFGALVCTPKNPACVECPVKRHCLGFARGTQLERPVSAKGVQIVRITMASGVLIHGGRLYIQKRRPDDVWPGLWEFPGGVVETGETPERALVREYAEECAVAVDPAGKAGVIKYSYTRYRVTLHGYFCRFSGDFRQPELLAADEGRFVSPAELDGYAFPSGHRRLIETIRSDVRLAALLAE